MAHNESNTPSGKSIGRQRLLTIAHSSPESFHGTPGLNTHSKPKRPNRSIALTSTLVPATEGLAAKSSLLYELVDKIYNGKIVKEGEQSHHDQNAASVPTALLTKFKEARLTSPPEKPKEPKVINTWRRTGTGSKQVKANVGTANSATEVDAIIPDNSSETMMASSIPVQENNNQSPPFTSQSLNVAPSRAVSRDTHTGQNQITSGHAPTIAVNETFTAPMMLSEFGAVQSSAVSHRIHHPTAAEIPDAHIARQPTKRNNVALPRPHRSSHYSRTPDSSVVRSLCNDQGNAWDLAVASSNNIDDPQLNADSFEMFHSNYHADPDREAELGFLVQLLKKRKLEKLRKNQESFRQRVCERSAIEKWEASVQLHKFWRSIQMQVMCAVGSAPEVDTPKGRLDGPTIRVSANRGASSQGCIQEGIFKEIQRLLPSLQLNCEVVEAATEFAASPDDPGSWSNFIQREVNKSNHVKHNAHHAKNDLTAGSSVLLNCARAPHSHSHSHPSPKKHVAARASQIVHGDHVNHNHGPVHHHHPHVPPSDKGATATRITILNKRTTSFGRSGLNVDDGDWRDVAVIYETAGAPYLVTRSYEAQIYASSRSHRKGTVVAMDDSVVTPSLSIAGSIHEDSDEATSVSQDDRADKAESLRIVSQGSRISAVVPSVTVGIKSRDTVDSHSNSGSPSIELVCSSERGSADTVHMHPLTDQRQSSKQNPPRMGVVSAWLVEKSRMQRLAQQEREQQDTHVEKNLDKPTTRNEKQQVAKRGTKKELDCYKGVAESPQPQADTLLSSLLRVGIVHNFELTSPSSDIIEKDIIFVPPNAPVVFISGGNNYPTPHREQRTFVRYPIKIKGGDVRDLVFDESTLTLHVIETRGGMVVWERCFPLHVLTVTEPPSSCSSSNTLVTLRASDTSNADGGYIGCVDRVWWSQLARRMTAALDAAVNGHLDTLKRAGTQLQHRAVPLQKENNNNDTNDVADVSQKVDMKWYFATSGEDDVSEVDDPPAGIHKQRIQDKTASHANADQSRAVQREGKCNSFGVFQEELKTHPPLKFQPVKHSTSLQPPRQYAEVDLSFPGEVSRHLQSSGALANATLSVRHRVKEAILNQRNPCEFVKPGEMMDSSRPLWALPRIDSKRVNENAILSSPSALPRRSMQHDHQGCDQNDPGADFAQQPLQLLISPIQNRVHLVPHNQKVVDNASSYHFEGGRMSPVSGDAVIAMPAETRTPLKSWDTAVLSPATQSNINKSSESSDVNLSAGLFVVEGANVQHELNSSSRTDGDDEYDEATLEAEIAKPHLQMPPLLDHSQGALIVVDSNKTTHMCISKMSMDLGFRVETFTNPFEAAAALRRSPGHFAGTVFLNDADLRRVSPFVALCGIGCLTDLSTTVNDSPAVQWNNPTDHEERTDIYCSDHIFRVRIVVYGFETRFSWEYGKDQFRNCGSNISYHQWLFENCCIPHIHYHDRFARAGRYELDVDMTEWTRERLLTEAGADRIEIQPLSATRLKKIMSAYVNQTRR